MIRPLALVSIAALSLAACGAPDPVEPKDAAPAPESPAAPDPATPGAPTSAAGKLTAQGFGPLRIGMTKSEVEAALGADSNPNAAAGADPESCDMFHPSRAPEGLLVMIENDRLTSVWLRKNTAIETDRALSIGDPAAEVKRVYGSAATVTPHKYQEAPAEYVTAWSSADHTSPAARGVKYEIGSDGRVSGIAAGGSSIDYVEGCA